ncbi:MAG: hypothetical protein NUV86_00950 [Candidatus Scalindua sp.]|nr:hypothetical protein [Candidatus Scalindua sp.]MCR4343156.1 hypothetical protein [Candidatus Scalindua sp.]
MVEKILVLENHRHTLTVLRSLANTGYDPIVGCHDQIDKKFALSSRYTKEIWPHPGFNEEEKFTEALVCLLKKRSDIAYIFPVGEACLLLLARNYDKISRFCGIIMPNPIAIEICINKAMTCKLVRDMNIPLPETSIVRSFVDINTQIEKIGYPFILKPKIITLGASFYGKKCIICNTPDEYKKYFPKWPERYHDLILQRKVSGIRYSCLFTSFKGNIISYFEEKTLRTDAYDGTGNAIDSVSSNPSKQRKDFSELLTRRLDYTGIGCIQFLVNEEDGSCYFMEFNPRLDANSALPYYCGVDFPRQAIDVHRYLMGKITSLPQYSRDYPVNKRIHWLFGDISGLLIDLKQKRISVFQGIGWFFRILNSFYRASYHMTWSWKDPLPTLVMYKQELLNIITHRLNSLRLHKTGKS